MAELKKVQVTVKVDNHTHAGERCKAGDVIEVWEDTAEWLEKQGVIEPLKKAPKKKTTTEDEGSSAE